jgi:hypothetical protein
MSRMRARSPAGENPGVNRSVRSMTASPAVALTPPPASGGAGADDTLAAFCPDLDQWPTSWRYDERDVAPGQQMVACFKPFLRYLLSLGLSGKTLRRHRDNLWLLGGALVRDLHEAPRLRKRPIDEVVRQAIDDEGGPLIGHGAAAEVQQRSFDATCRRFYCFLKDCDSASTARLWTCGQR